MVSEKHWKSHIFYYSILVSLVHTLTHTFMVLCIFILNLQTSILLFVILVSPVITKSTSDDVNNSKRN